MMRFIALLVPLIFALATQAAEPKWAPLPIPLSNNAVALARVNKRLVLFSFMGIGAQKNWTDISNRAFSLDPQDEKWNEIRPVPGPAGRLGSSAVTVKDVIYLLGGYTVDGRGDETSVRSVEVLVPSKSIWYRAADLPMPLDSSVVGVYRERFIYTISGRSQNRPVSNVQVYDVQKDRWQQATPIKGTPVFGHAGGIVDDAIVYCDGAYQDPAAGRRYLASDECWMGKIDHRDVTKIQWSKLPGHPGNARYGIAAGPSDRDQRIYFTGGAANPHNFKGVDYDGKPAEPAAMTFAFNLRTNKWDIIHEKTPNPTMDNRGLLITSKSLLTIGGMEAGQKVTSRVNVIPLK